MSNIKTYKEAWEKISPLPNGGQGTTIKARNIFDGQTLCAVKVLNRQNDEERRARMYRETVALITLNHNNITKVIDSNTENYKDKSYSLYLATEFIEGDTLSEVSRLNLSFNQKVFLILKVCEVIEYCHKRGIIHRDIKPDNIILRNNSYEDPVILDFGISFNFNDSDDDTLTPDGQHLGNRFLILPEQKIGETSKRDMRSDVTSIVGLFFFILTNDFPVVLEDGNEKQPHQRESSKEVINGLPKHLRDSLNYLFDVGFSQHIDRRWQSITSLTEQFKVVDQAQAPELNSIEDKITFIQSYYHQQTYVETRNLSKLKYEVSRKYDDLLNKVYQELGDDWSGVLRLRSRSKFASEGYQEVGLYSNTYLKVTITAHIKVYTTGNEIVILSLMEGDFGSISRIEAFREPILNTRNWKSLEDVIRSEFISIVTQEIQKRV